MMISLAACGNEGGESAEPTAAVMPTGEVSPTEEVKPTEPEPTKEAEPTKAEPTKEAEPTEAVLIFGAQYEGGNMPYHPDDREEYARRAD